MYLPRSLSLHVKPISLFCMQIHSGCMTRDRLCFLLLFLHRDMESALKSIFTLVKLMHDAADKFALTSLQFQSNQNTNIISS